MNPHEYHLQSDTEKEIEKAYTDMYADWCETWKKSFESEFWKRITKFNEVLPIFHPIDKQTFTVLGKIHMKKCQEKHHVLGLCGFSCKQTDEQKQENQDKALLLFRLIDHVEEQENAEVKKKLIELKACFYGIVWSQQSKEDFIKKIKKIFLNFNCETIEKFL